MFGRARLRSLLRTSPFPLTLALLLVNAAFLTYVMHGGPSCASNNGMEKSLALTTEAYPFCDACGPQDTLCAQYGDHNLARSRAYEGAAARLKRVIRKAQAGEPVKIAALGGSVTRGHGIQPPENWFTLFVHWWEDTFPQSKTTWINGAIPATGSDYMSMCFLEHIENDVDLVFTEIAVNDQRIEPNAEAFEWLMRALLGMPKNPAVVNVQTFGLAYPLLSTGGDLHTPVAMYYDVPSLNLRNVLLPQILTNSSLDRHYFANLTRKGDIDWRHIGKFSHRVLADMSIAFVQRTICAIAREDQRARMRLALPSAGQDVLAFGTPAGGAFGLPREDALEDIPRLRMLQKYDQTSHNGPVVPFCMSTRTKKHPLVPVANSGWANWTFTGQKEKPYVRATEPGATISFRVRVHSVGRVRITYLKSNTFGLGSVACWLDSAPARRVRVDGWWKVQNINIASVYVISRDAAPGVHVLTCELLHDTLDPGQGHEFRLIAVDAA